MDDIRDNAEQVIDMNRARQMQDLYAQKSLGAVVGSLNSPDPSNTIANYHEREVEAMKSIATRDDQELRLKCLQTTLQFANGDMAKATNTAQLAYDFITGKRVLSEVTGG